MRHLCRTNLYFLIRYVFNRDDFDHPWLYERCNEVQEDPFGRLDLWARDHRKSTIITFGHTIFEILRSHGDNPYDLEEVTVGIFSHTRPIAKSFLRQIKRELEQNKQLIGLFPDILYENPERDAPTWSEDGGLVLKRKHNPKEATVEAHGLVDGQPVGKHFNRLVYDDVVTLKSVSTAEMIQKTTDAWALSLNLGTEHGKIKYIGTRYHYNDSYREIMGRDAATPRLHAGTKDGTLDGEPVLLSAEVWRRKVREMGTFVASCHTAGNKILMADWSERSIEDVCVGDEVIGYEFGGSAKIRAVKTKVVACSKRQAETVEYRLASGHSGRCTPYHKWFTGRNGNDHHESYLPLGFGYHGEIAFLIKTQAADIPEPTDEQRIAAAYLAGMIDGEGSIHRQSGKITITQSMKHNPDICAKIRATLTVLDIDFHERLYEDHGQQVVFSVRGGRREQLRLMRWCDSVKLRRMGEYMFGTKIGLSAGNKDTLVSLDPSGTDFVYNIQTESGNYIVNGYASKNCQLLQNPKPDSASTFKETDLRFYHGEISHSAMNRYILVDPANEKKKKSDYTAVVVVGLAPDHNYYVLAMHRDKLGLTERTKLLFRLHQKYQPLTVFYEQYGMQSDVQHIQYVQNQENYRFHVEPFGGQQSKQDRIRRLLPITEANRLWLPALQHRTIWDGSTVDLVEQFLQEEYKPFPLIRDNDDMLDIMSRIADPDLTLNFPRLPVEAEKRDPYSHQVRRGTWMARR